MGEWGGIGGIGGNGEDGAIGGSGGRTRDGGTMENMGIKGGVGSVRGPGGQWGGGDGGAVGVSVSPHPQVPVEDPIVCTDEVIFPLTIALDKLPPGTVKAKVGTAGTSGDPTDIGDSVGICGGRGDNAGSSRTSGTSGGLKELGDSVGNCGDMWGLQGLWGRCGDLKELRDV